MTRNSVLNSSGFDFFCVNCPKKTHVPGGVNPPRPPLRGWRAAEQPGHGKSGFRGGWWWGLVGLVLGAGVLTCGEPWSAHVPALDGCPRVPVELVTATDGCLLLTSANANAEHPDVLFRLTSSTSCGGPSVLCLQPGDSAEVLERVRPSPVASWSVVPVVCSEVPQCL
jgi:hypothetical protein